MGGQVGIQTRKVLPLTWLFFPLRPLISKTHLVRISDCGGGSNYGGFVKSIPPSLIERFPYVTWSPVGVRLLAPLWPLMFKC